MALLPPETRPAQGPAWAPWTPRSTGPILLIAELANAHEGRVEAAEEMIRAAAEAGCGAVKLQKYYADEMLAAGHKLRPMFAGWEWPRETWEGLVELAKRQGLKVFVDVFGLRAYESLRVLAGIDGWKVPAADLGNAPLLDALAEDPRPVLVGTGACTDWEIHSALSRLGPPERLVLMHGFQAFPTPLEETALSRLSHFAETFGLPVGLSDHLDASDPFARTLPLLAVPLGACCVEKHLTLDRSRKSVDYQSSLEPAELRALAADLRKAQAARGEAGLPESALQDGYRRRFKKALVAARPIAAGARVAAEDLAFHMTEAPERHSLAWDAALGRTTARAVPAGRILSGGDLGAKTGLCLIARLKSARLPRKALADIHGMPAIHRLFERAKRCSAAERAVLCTSTDPQDAPLLEAAAKAGLESYAGDPEQPLERLIHCAERWGWDYVVRATGDNIFLDPELLARAAELASEQNLDYVSMFGAPVGTHCEIMRVTALKAVASHAEAPYGTEYLTWYLAGNPNFRCADLEVPSAVRRSWRLTLDTPQDLENIREAVALLGPENHDYSLADLVRAVESRAELARRIELPPQGMPQPPVPPRFRFQLERPS